ncbi:MAG: hypothetical protein ABIO06_01855 [Pseudolysinimonas sp.]
MRRCYAGLSTLDWTEQYCFVRLNGLVAAVAALSTTTGTTT